MLSRAIGYAIGTVVLCAVLAMPASAAQAQQPFDYAAAVDRVLERHALPRFAALKDAAARLEPAVSALCTSGAAQDRKSAREAFRATAAALAAVDFYRFGPLAEQGRRERLAFWPDPRGVMQRQLRVLLAAVEGADAPAIDIGQQSAAVQGLPALEVLMTDEGIPLGPKDAAKSRCRLAVNIARNIADVARDVDALWRGEGGMAGKLRQTGPDAASYKSHAEAAGELVKALLTGLQFVSETQLKPRAAKGTAATFKGPYAKLGFERDVYKSASGSLHDLYNALDLEGALAADKSWIKGWASGAWRAMDASDGMSGASSAGSQGPPVSEIVSRIGGLRMLIGKEMSNAAGIAIGFNELDGD